MKDFFVNLLKLILSILIFLFTEEYVYKALNSLGVSIHNKSFISLIIYVIMALCIYIVYKDDINAAFHKYKYKLTTNLFYTVLSFIIVFIGMMIVDYLVSALAKGFNINYLGLNFINIFSYKFNFNFIVVLLRDIIIIPFIKSVIFILGISNMINKKYSTFFSGLIYGLYMIYVLCKFNSSFGYMLINFIPYFALFGMLSFIYKKNKNISYSILILIFYELFSSILIKKFM